MIHCAKDFDIDWVTVMSDPWAEASAFGIEVEYPEKRSPGRYRWPSSQRGNSSIFKDHTGPMDNIRCRKQDC